jgi:hypothetical protein
METLSPTPIAPMPEQSLAVVPTTAEEMAPFEADYNGVVPVNNLPEADAPSTQLVRNEESKTDDVAETEQDLVVGIAGTGHDARLYAKDAGHEKHLSYLEEKSGVRNIARKIWSGVSGGAKRNKLDLESRQEIEANAHNNLFMHHGVTDEEWTDMARDTITRFTGEYEHSLDHDAGERGAEISNESDPNAVAIKTAVKGLIRDYAEGNLTDESFGEEKKRVLAELASNGVTSELLGEGATFADNLHDIAKAVVKRIGN